MKIEKGFLMVLTGMIIFLFGFGQEVLAGTFQLKSLGGMDTGGANYSHWWYTSAQPTLTGSALASENVAIGIDGASFSTSADASGNWSYTPPALSEGDHSVSLSSGGSTIAFTLTIGEDVPEGVGVPSAAETPVVGIAWPTLAMGGLGVTVLLVVMWRRQRAFGL